MREIFYEYSANAVPPDPTVNSDRYTAPLPYANGYYKAIAREDGVVTAVTSVSFERSPTDYIHHYEFNDNYNDSVSGGINLTNVGCSFVDGKNGRAVSFNGTTDYLKLLGYSSQPDMSIVLTVKLTDLGNRNIFYYGSSDEYALNSDSINIRNTKSNIYLYDGTAKNASSSSSPVISEWITYCVIFRNNGNSELYLNGNLVVTLSTGTRWTGGDRLLFGKDNPNFSRFNGIIDEIKIFNRAVTADEAILLTTE